MLYILYIEIDLSKSPEDRRFPLRFMRGQNSDESPEVAASRGFATNHPVGRRRVKVQMWTVLVSGQSW